MRVLPNLPKESNQLEKDFITISYFYKLMFLCFAPIFKTALYLLIKKKSVDYLNIVALTAQPHINAAAECFRLHGIAGFIPL